MPTLKKKPSKNQSNFTLKALERGKQTKGKVIRRKHNNYQSGTKIKTKKTREKIN